MHFEIIKTHILEMMLATHLISRSLHPPWGLVDTKWTENFLHKCDLSCLAIHWSLAAVGEREGMSQLLLLGKFEYGGGPIFKVVLEC